MQNLEVIHTFYLKHIKFWTSINWTNIYVVH